MKILLSVLFLVLTLNLSCASREERLEKVKQQVEELKNNTELIRGHKLFYATDSLSSSFTYFHDGSTIRIINEEMIISNLGNSFNLHYYDNGSLIYIEQRQLKYAPSEKGFDKLISNIDIYFDKSGNLLESDKIINQQKVEMSQSDIEEIFNHSRKLYEISQKDFSEKTHAH